MLLLLTAPRCAKITLAFCHDIGYNATSSIHKTNFEEGLPEGAIIANLNCSTYLRHFACSIFVPKCSSVRERHFPCRYFCEDIRSKCRHKMEKYGIPWPKELQCSQFLDVDECYAPHSPGIIMKSNKLQIETLC